MPNGPGRFDIYTPTPDRVIEEHKNFGIVADWRWSISGLLDLSFKNFLGKPFISLNEEEHERITLGHITGMFNSGLFYFSVDMDITCGRQASYERQNTRKSSSERLANYAKLYDAKVSLAKDFEMIDERFMFNKTLLSGIFELDYFPFFLPTIFGYVGSTEFLLDSITHHYTLISRCSSKRAGTRYFRGLDEEGSCAIEVETEQILITDNRLMSYRQLRGSTPLIWKSSPPDEILQPVTIDVTWAKQPVSRDSLHLHLVNLIERYGHPVTLISLLNRSNEKDRYKSLADAFREVFDGLQIQLGVQKIRLVEFDENHFVADIKTQMPKVIETLNTSFTNQGFFSHNIGFLDESFQHVMESRQHGIFRINGVDCIDMTNVVQFNIAEKVLYGMLASCGIHDLLPNSQNNKVKDLWVHNGRALALLHTGVPRVLYEEQIKSNWIIFLFGETAWWCIVRLGRLYMGTFRDSRRQEAFECMLGKMKHTADDAILLQKSVLRLATNQKSGLAFFILLKRFLAPRHVNTIPNLILAGIWLLGQAIVRTIVGETVWQTSELPRVGSRLDTRIIESSKDTPVIGLNSELKKRTSRDAAHLLEKAGSRGPGSKRNSTSRRLTIS
ncbi:inositol polyphosphate 5-phosphatase [Entophlyctis sp. JEL0112]|nr:inositol polyphosphate 5-phosphatase [Entophlyctis sp. JEL0112]